MTIDKLVRCLDTGIIGVALETKNAGYCMLVLVEWPNEKQSPQWVDSKDLEVIDSYV